MDPQMPLTSLMRHQTRGVTLMGSGREYMKEA